MKLISVKNTLKNIASKKNINIFTSTCCISLSCLEFGKKKWLKVLHKKSFE